VRVIEDGQTIMSASPDGTVKVWDIPQGRPLHDRPIEEFLALLRAQTNMRIVPDADEDVGYRITYDPFPGWAEPPPPWQ
jgi:hypothetical protein